MVLLFFTLGLSSVKADDAVQKYYNLTASDIIITPSNPAVNQLVKITVRVKNNSNVGLYTSQGLDDFAATFDNFFQTKLSYNAPSYNNIVVAGDYVSYSFEGKFTTAGNKNLNFKVDDKNLLEELTLNGLGYPIAAEDDNQLNQAVTVVPADYDLAIDSFALTYDQLVGHPVELKINVKNTGQASLIDEIGLNSVKASYTTLPGLVINNTKHDDYPTLDKPLLPGQLFTYTYNGVVDKVGAVNFTFKVNNDSGLKESNLNNNASSTALTFYGNATQADDFNLTEPKITPISSSSLMVKWSVDKAVATKLLYKLSYAEFSEADGGTSLAPSITLTDLLPGQTYMLQVYGKNNSVEKYGAMQLFKMPENDDFLNIKVSSTTVPIEIVQTPIVPAPPVNKDQPQVGNDKPTSPVVVSSTPAMPIKNEALYAKLKGKIILTVESKGEAYYVNPQDKKVYSLGRPTDAFKVMREQGSGISNANLNKIQVGLSDLSGLDTDKDGLPDALEQAIGTNKTKADSDKDGYSDAAEIETGNNPNGPGKTSLSLVFARSNAGRIFIQTEGKGEAWYINPRDDKRYFLGRPADAFAVMKSLGLGVTNQDFLKLK